MLRFGSFVRAQSAAEALELLRSKRGSKIVGGGAWMRLSQRTLSCAIDLSDAGLNYIHESDNEVRIGAMVSLREVERHPGVQAATCGVVSRALADIVGVQFRSVATIGGSIYGRFGFSDVLCALLPFDCDVILTGAGRMSLVEFSHRDFEPDVLEAVVLRKGVHEADYQCVRRTATDFPTLNVCAAHVHNEWRVAVGARPARAMLLTPEQTGLCSAVPSDEELASAARVLRALPFSSNMWGSAEYRRHLAGVLGVRAVCQAAARPIPAELTTLWKVGA